MFTFPFLGKPVHESTEAGCTNSKIVLNWSLSELNNFVCQSYPRISLNLVGFELARTGKGRKIQKLQVSSVKELKAVVGKSRLYIVPRATVLQVWNYTQGFISYYNHINVFSVMSMPITEVTLCSGNITTLCHVPEFIPTTRSSSSR